MFYKQPRCSQFEWDSRSNFWVLIRCFESCSFELFKVLLKVSKSQNQFFLKLHSPKNEQNIGQNSNGVSRKNAFEIYWPIEVKYHRTFFVKVAQWKNGFLKKPRHTANLNFLFLSLFVYLWKNCSSQFLGGKIQICCIVRSFSKAVLPLGHL